LAQAFSLNEAYISHAKRRLVSPAMVQSIMQTTTGLVSSRSCSVLVLLAALANSAIAVVSRSHTVTRVTEEGREAREASAFPPFESFVEVNGRAYIHGSAEYEQRESIYKRRAAEASEHNSNPGRRWTAGVNHLWDWTDNELSTLHGWSRSARPEASGFVGHGGPRLAGRPRSQGGEFLAQQLSPLPAEKSWTHLTSAKNVHNQGGCGSCWAIASATMLEAHTEIHSARRTFSAQQLVSCVPNPQECGGEGGCRGATAELAMDWVMNHGCPEEFEVPYSGSQSACDTTHQETTKLANASSAGAGSWGMKRWERLPENQYEPLMRAVVELGPVAVSVAATTWHTYSHGIFDSCSADAIIDHAVLLDGYGEDQSSGAKYWLIQNSWGQDWGEKGFIRVLRRDTDQDECGIDNQPQLGSGCKGGPPQVRVCGMCGILYDTVVVHFS